MTVVACINKLFTLAVSHDQVSPIQGGTAKIWVIRFSASGLKINIHAAILSQFQTSKIK